MVFFRWLVLLAFLGAIVAFVLYALTGQTRYRDTGLTILKWTLLPAFGFFAVLIVQRLL
jgi:hypothetical protein